MYTTYSQSQNSPILIIIYKIDKKRFIINFDEFGRMFLSVLWKKIVQVKIIYATIVF